MAAEMNNGKRPRFVNFFIVFLIFLGVISVCTIGNLMYGTSLNTSLVADDNDCPYRVQPLPSEEPLTAIHWMHGYAAGIP